MVVIMQDIVKQVDPYIMQILMNIGIAIIMALGLNLITGVTGQLSLGHAAFMSIGAFTSAIITLNTGLPFAINLLLAGLTAAMIGALIAFPILRLTGDYLAIATLGFSEILKVLLLNMKITNGALGLSVPSANTEVPMPIVILIVVILSIVAMVCVHNSRFGRSLMAIREDEIAAEAMGINATLNKLQAFAVGSFLAGLGGGLYAHVILYINPSDFGFMKSIDMLNMVVLGGLGSIPGAVLGASILAAAPEFLRFMQQYRMLVYGALLVFLMVFRPNGLLGGVNFRKLVLKALGRSKTAKAGKS